MVVDSVMLISFTQVSFIFDLRHQTYIYTYISSLVILYVIGNDKRLLLPGTRALLAVRVSLEPS